MRLLVQGVAVAIGVLIGGILGPIIFANVSVGLASGGGAVFLGFVFLAIGRAYARNVRVEPHPSQAEKLH